MNSFRWSSLWRQPSRKKGVSDATSSPEPFPTAEAALMEALKPRVAGLTTDVVDFARDRCARALRGNPRLAFALGRAIGGKRPASIAEIESLIAATIEANAKPASVSNSGSPSRLLRRLDALDPSGARSFFYIPLDEDDVWMVCQVVARRRRDFRPGFPVLESPYIGDGLLMEYSDRNLHLDFPVEFRGAVERIERVSVMRLYHVEYREALCARLSALAPPLFALLSLPEPPRALVEAIQAARSLSLELGDAGIEFKCEVSHPYWTEGDQVLVALDLRLPASSPQAA